jgi:hypothetical protein
MSSITHIWYWTLELDPELATFRHTYCTLHSYFLMWRRVQFEVQFKVQFASNWFPSLGFHPLRTHPCLKVCNPNHVGGLISGGGDPFLLQSLHVMEILHVCIIFFWYSSKVCNGVGSIATFFLGGKRIASCTTSIICHHLYIACDWLKLTLL